jgi:hypothetical protein
VIQSKQMVPSGIKIGKEQLNILAYADRKKWNRNKTTFCRNGKRCQKTRTIDKPRKTKYVRVERKNALRVKQNNIGHLKTKITD